MDESIELDCMTYNMSQVIDILRKEAPKLQTAEGRDLIIVIGETQAGKSTLINALNGSKFKGNRYGSLDLVSKGGEFAEMGTHLKANESCTEYPTLYHSRDTSYYFLDTRGFFDVRSNGVTETASTFLFEIAVKKAKNVRIIVLSPYDELEKGFSDFQRIGRIIAKIVTITDVNVYFLFNQYRPPKVRYEAFMNLDEMRKNEYILQELRERCHALVSAEKNLFVEILSLGRKQMYGFGQSIHRGFRTLYCGSTSSVSTTTCSPSSASLNTSTSGHKENEHQTAADSFRSASAITVESSQRNEVIDENKSAINQQPSSDNDKNLAFFGCDSDYKAKAERLRYAGLLEECFAANLYGYVDPLQQDSLNRLKATFDKIPVVSKEELNINAANPKRIQFVHEFEKVLQLQKTPMKKAIFSFKYSRDVASLRRQYIEKVKTHEANLKKLTNPDCTLEVSNIYDKDDTERITSLISDLTFVKKEKDELDASINKIKSGPEEVLVRIPLNGDSRQKDSINYRVTYPDSKIANPIRYSRVEQNLPQNIQCSKVYCDDGIKYDVEFTSGGTINRKDNDGRVIVRKSLFTISSQNGKGEVILYTKPEYRQAESLKELQEQQAMHVRLIDSIAKAIDDLKSVARTKIREQIESSLNTYSNTLNQLNNIDNAIKDTISKFTEPYPRREHYYYKDYSDKLQSYEMCTQHFFEHTNPIVNHFLNDLETLRKLKLAYESSISTDSETLPSVKEIICEFAAIFEQNNTG